MYVYKKEPTYNKNWFLNLKWIIMRNYIKVENTCHGHDNLETIIHIPQFNTR